MAKRPANKRRKLKIARYADELRAVWPERTFSVVDPANYSDYTPHLRRGVVEAIRKLREIERAH